MAELLAQISGSTSTLPPSEADTCVCACGGTVTACGLWNSGLSRSMIGIKAEVTPLLTSEHRSRIAALAAEALYSTCMQQA